MIGWPIRKIADKIHTAMHRISIHCIVRDRRDCKGMQTREAEIAEIINVPKVSVSNVPNLVASGAPIE
jgi:hypothetical protein